MLEITSKAKLFALSQITPKAKEIDEKQEFPSQIFKELANEGFLKLMVPKEFGGLGGNALDHSLVCLEFAKASATTALCYMMHNVALNCLRTYASKELQEKIFSDVVNNGKFCALAYSEIGSGTHFYAPQMSVEVKDNKAIFNGIKSMVTSANHASYYLVLTPSQNGVAGSTDNWVLPLGTPGLGFNKNSWNGLGMRGNVSCQMKLENASLDTTYRIGQIGSGAEQVFSAVAPMFLLGLGAVYSGLANNIADEAIKHAKDRKYPDGKSLAHIETIQNHLSEIYTKAQAAIALVKEAANELIEGSQDAGLKVFAARVNASKIVVEVASTAMRVGGGKAYNKSGELERLLRDAYAGQVMAPSVDVLSVWLGKSLCGIELF